MKLKGDTEDEKKRIETANERFGDCCFDGSCFFIRFFRWRNTWLGRAVNCIIYLKNLTILNHKKIIFNNSVIPLELQEKSISYFLRNSLLFSPCGGGETTIQRVRKISGQLKKAAYWGRKLLREVLYP